MPFATLTDEEEKELYRLQRVHGQEALRCEESKAYLAGCVMLGSALETILILMVNIYSDEAEQTGNVPTKMASRSRCWTGSLLNCSGSRFAPWWWKSPCSSPASVSNGAGGGWVGIEVDFMMFCDHGTVFLYFRHSKWHEDAKAFPHCSMGWTFRGDCFHSQSSIGGSLQSDAWHPSFQDALRSKRPFPSASAIG